MKKIEKRAKKGKKNIKLSVDDTNSEEYKNLRDRLIGDGFKYESNFKTQSGPTGTRWYDEITFSWD